jgi:hypothetical protein
MAPCGQAYQRRGAACCWCASLSQAQPRLGRGWPTSLWQWVADTGARCASHKPVEKTLSVGGVFDFSGGLTRAPAQRASAINRNIRAHRRNIGGRHPIFGARASGHRRGLNFSQNRINVLGRSICNGKSKRSNALSSKTVSPNSAFSP